jgi:hypothetical protein
LRDLEENRDPSAQRRRVRDFRKCPKNQKGAASGPRPFKFYVTDELASLTNRVATGRKNIPGGKKSCNFPAPPQGLASQ